MGKLPECEPLSIKAHSPHEWPYLGLFDYIARLAFQNRENGSPNIAARLGIHGVLKVYHRLSEKATERRLKPENRERYIKHWFADRGIIDISTPEKADEGFRVITEGYEWTRAHRDLEDIS